MLKQTTRLEFFFRRIESDGESLPVMTSSVWTMLSRERTEASAFSIIGFILSPSPTSATESSGSCWQACIAALQGSSGAWSPPMASSAISISRPPIFRYCGCLSRRRRNALRISHARRFLNERSPRICCLCACRPSNARPPIYAGWQYLRRAAAETTISASIVAIASEAACA